MGNLCECGNERERFGNGRLKHACNRCIEMESKHYETVAPPSLDLVISSFPGPKSRAQIQRDYRKRIRDKEVARQHWVYGAGPGTLEG